MVLGFKWYPILTLVVILSIQYSLLDITQHSINQSENEEYNLQEKITKSSCKYHMHSHEHIKNYIASYM